jgi:hypothetical protein
MTSVSLESSFLPYHSVEVAMPSREPQHWQWEQQYPSSEKVEDGLQGQQHRRRWSLTSSSIPLLLQCSRVLKGSLLKMLHTDGGETLRTFVNIRPWSSSLHYNIIHNTGGEILNQFNNIMYFMHTR